MGKRTALLTRDEAERVVDDLVDEAALYAWDTPAGRYHRLLVDMAMAHLDSVLKPKKRKPKAKKAKPKRRARA